MLGELLVGLLVFFYIYFDFIFPYVVYPLRARRHRGGQLSVTASRPLGIPLTVRILRALRQDRLLSLIAENNFKKKQKTVLQQSLIKWTVMTREPENIKAVLATKFNDFSLRDRNVKMRPVFGSGIFTQDHGDWKHSRAMLRPQFSKENISRLRNLSRHINTMIDEFGKHDNRVELQHFFHLMTMDTATEFLFGESVDSLRFSDDSKGVLVIDPTTGSQVYSADFVESYTWLNAFALQKMVFNSLHWVAGLLNPSHRFHSRRAHIFIDHYVNKALEKVPENAEKTELGNDDEYIFSYEVAKETRDPIVIRDQIFNILIAGRDTTASSLSYAFYYFATHPHVYQKVREEVLEAFPEGDASSVTYEDLRKLKYLQMVIKEVLRLSPAVPLNSRTAVRDTYLPRGGGPNMDKPVFVPRGTVVNYPIYVVHRDPMIYGRDANEFNPDRWLPENRKADSPMYSWGYLPFNGGPRICLGQQFALTEISLTIVWMSFAYKSVEPDVGFSPELHNRSTLTSMVGGTGVPVKLVPA